MKPDCSEQRSEWGVESKNNEDRLGFSICRQSVNNYSFVRFFQSLYLLFIFLLSTLLVRAFRTMLNSSRGGRNPCSSLLFKRNLMIPCWERYLVHTIYQVNEVPFHSYIVELFFFFIMKGCWTYQIFIYQENHEVFLLFVKVANYSFRFFLLISHPCVPGLNLTWS